MGKSKQKNARKKTAKKVRLKAQRKEKEIQIKNLEKDNNV